MNGSQLGQDVEVELQVIDAHRKVRGQGPCISGEMDEADVLWNEVHWASDLHFTAIRASTVTTP